MSAHTESMTFADLLNEGSEAVYMPAVQQEIKAQLGFKPYAPDVHRTKTEPYDANLALELMGIDAEYAISLDATQVLAELSGTQLKPESVVALGIIAVTGRARYQHELSLAVNDVLKLDDERALTAAFATEVDSVNTLDMPAEPGSESRQAAA